MSQASLLPYTTSFPRTWMSGLVAICKAGREGLTPAWDSWSRSTGMPPAPPWTLAPVLTHLLWDPSVGAACLGRS